MTIFRELTQLIGEERLGALCALRGGGEVYIPEVPNAWMQEILGEDLARRLCTAHPGERLYIPKGAERNPSLLRRRVAAEAQEARDIAIRQARASGVTVRDLCRRFDLSRTRVYQILKEDAP
ncbi:MAG: Mor transcription activator family protein [Cyanobacteria bacterium J06638_20]